MRLSREKFWLSSAQPEREGLGISIRASSSSS